MLNTNCYIIKLQLDLGKQKAKNWCKEGIVPSEPLFVARPGATEEDDGECWLLACLVYLLHIIDAILVCFFN